MRPLLRPLLRPLPFGVTLALLLGALLPGPALAPRAARAEEAPSDDSPASKAYREAWWAETGGGDLAQALELYAKVLEAEGPASVKARALYRRALVLHRLGRGEEAVRTLERLAKEHPLLEPYLSEARARLAEWTAVDLETSFEAWYRRYQYSPEFQAKIVDLVLRMGSSEQAAAEAAYNEVLTIGGPALPALRQHLGSANGQLRERAVRALLALKEVPPLEALRQTSHWRRYTDLWLALDGLGAEARARLTSEADPRQPFDQALLARLEGPLPFWRWLQRHLTAETLSLVQALIQTLPLPGAGTPELDGLLTVLREVASDAAALPQLRELAVQRLIWRKAVAPADLSAWLREPSGVLRKPLLDALKSLSSAPALAQALSEVLPAARTWELSQRTWLAQALLNRLDDLPPEVELAAVARDLLALERGWEPFSGVALVSPRARALLAAVVDACSDPRVASQVLQTWAASSTGAEPGDLALLERWIRSAAVDEVRRTAVEQLARRSGAWQQHALLLVSASDLAVAERRGLLWNLLRGGGAEAATLLREPGSRRALLAGLRAYELQALTPASVPAGQNPDVAVVFPLLQLVERASELREALAQAWLDDPDGFPRVLLEARMADPYTRWANVPAPSMNAWNLTLATLPAAWAERWRAGAWTGAQREAAVRGLPFLGARGQEGVRPVLRAALRDRANGLSPEARQILLRQIAPLSVDDARQVFDLATPEGCDAAVRALFDKQVQWPEPSAELLESLALGLRPDAPPETLGLLVNTHGRVPGLELRLIQALLAHRSPSEQVRGVGWLAERESADDLPLWLKALALPEASVRQQAAQGLGRLAHPDATRALVKALDDPSSKVRDAALAALEAIQKVEDLKARWREKVR